MSWNMIIFGFGFILGGFTVTLLLGLVSIVNQRAAIPEDQGTVREAMPGFAKPEICPPLSVLSGGRDRVSFTGQKSKPFS